MRYIDSNIFIYAVINPDTDKDSITCRDILTRIAKKEIDACTSFLSWDEFVYVIRKFLGRDIAINQGSKFLEFPNLKFLKADEIVISKAQDLILSYNLKPRDAIHIASALVNNVNEVVSDDADLDKVKEIKRIKL